MPFPKLICLLFFTSLLAFSCKKDQSAQSTATPTVFGKWSLVNEEYTWTSPATGVFHDSIYTGKPGDDYEFTADGHLFASEGIYQDSGTYSFVNPVQIQFLPRVWNGVTVSSPGGGVIYGPEFTIATLTEHSLILSSSGLIPEGPVSDSITLKR